MCHILTQNLHKAHWKHRVDHETPTQIVCDACLLAAVAMHTPFLYLLTKSNRQTMLWWMRTIAKLTETDGGDVMSSC